MLLKRATVILGLFLFSSLGLGAVEPLQYTSDEAKTTLEILEKLNTKHYAKRAFDDELSQDLLKSYLELLDKGRIYFLEGDIKEFGKWSLTLDDTLKQGNLQPGFEIFNRYRQRVIDRLEKNIALIESGVAFDYSQKESIDYDSEDKPWAKTEAELDEVWRKRIKDSYLRLILADKDEKEIPQTLIKRYRNQLKHIQQADAEDAHQFYMNALTALYDPHTNYFSPRQLENFNISMSLKLEGIGAVLQMEDETTSVVRVIPGGPADQQGILAPEDKIIGVGQGNSPVEDVIGWRLDDVVDLIRGPKGSTVKLEIIPAKGESAGTNKVITLVRDEVKLEEQAAKSRVLDLEQDGKPFKLGVIDLPAFYIDFEAYNRRDPNFKSTTRDVARLIQELKAENVDGVVLDLRNNGGGSLHEVTTMTDLFIHPGPVVQVRQANHMVSRGYRSRREALYDGPLLVLINRLSASASEIFAGAIQDYGRGLIVGTQSYGKGTVQALVPLHEGQIKLTESKFYRVSGDSTQHRGVVPDIQLASIFDTADIGESSKEYALPWDQIHQVPIKRYDYLTPKQLQILNKRHESRIKVDPDYTYLLEELKLSEERRKNTLVSLNIDERKKEQEIFETALFNIENKRRKAKGMDLYASVKAWKEADEKHLGDDDEIEEAAATDDETFSIDDDPLLKEAGHILIDQIEIGGSQTQSPSLQIAEQGS